MFTGIGVVVMYAALGCGWLILKTDDGLQSKMYELMPKLIIALFIIFAAVSLYTPYSQPAIAAKWFTVPQLIYFSPVPILVIIFTVLTWRACLNRNEHKPFLYTLVLMFLAYSGFVITLWPNIIPPSVTIWEAAAPRNSQMFALIGAVVMIPIILAYTFWGYWIFRDKVRVGDQGYH